MKVHKSFRLILLLALILLQQMCVTGQNSATNKYTVAYKDSNYTFDVALHKDYYTIKLDSSPKAEIVYLQLSNNNAFQNAINKVFSAAKNEIFNCKAIADSLYLMLKAKEQDNLSHIQKLENDKGADVAFIKLKNSTVASYLMSNKKSDTTQLEKKIRQAKRLCDFKQNKIQIALQSVSIAFENGLIKDILVRAQNESGNEQYYFSNRDYLPIRNGQDIDRLACKNKYYLTFQYNQDSTLVLDLADILDYNRQVSCSSGTYIPKDTTINISTTHQEEIRLHKPSISESFDVRLFSDALGYSGKNPNGIIQIEAQLDFYLNQGNHFGNLFDIWKTGNTTHYRYQKVWLNRISPYFKLAKIEKNNSYINESKIPENKILMEMYKHANLDFGTDFNIYTFRSDSKLFSINLAPGIIRTTFGKDSLDESKSDVTSLYLHPYLGLKFFESNRIDFDVKCGAYALWKISSINPTTVIETITHKNEFISFLTNHCWLELGQSINLHPGGNKQTSVFVRAAQYIGMNNNYFTFQIGYSTTISNILKF